MRNGIFRILITLLAIICSPSAWADFFVKAPKPMPQPQARIISQAPTYITHQPGDRYALQIFGVQHWNSLQHFVEQHHIANKTWYYQAHKNGKTWFILLYGNYSSMEAARNARNHLPQFLQRYHPYVIRLKSTRQTQSFTTTSSHKPITVNYAQPNYVNNTAKTLAQPQDTLISVNTIAMDNAVSSATSSKRPYTLFPVLSVIVGLDNVRANHNQRVNILTSPLVVQNGYVTSGRRKNKLLLGVYAGLELPLPYSSGMSLQGGLGFYQSTFYLSGVVNQFANPNFDNFNYNYRVRNRRLLVEAKLLGTFHNMFHPNVQVGLGGNFNTAYGYQETSRNAFAVPMAPFADNSKRSFSYYVGVGLDADCDAHIRLGGSYRFAYLGKAALGQSTAVPTGDTLHSSQLYTREFLLNFSYLL